MSIGLDLGTTELRSVRIVGEELTARRCRAAYLVLRDSPGHRRLLEHIQARHAICGDDLVVFGDDAVECGSMLDLTVNPLLRNGRLPSADPVARQILALMVEAVLPPAERFGSVCCLTVPGGYSAQGDHQSLDVRFLKQLVALRGYNPQLTSPGLALVLTELASSSFSGLGISLGATNCEIDVVHCGRSVARWSTAGNLSELSEEFPADGASAAKNTPIGVLDSQQAAWERVLLRMLSSILSEARAALVEEGSLRMIPQPTPIACNGGITTAPGFLRVFEQAWQQSAWPIQIGRVQIADNPNLAIARGCLIQAIMEGRTPSERFAA